MYKMWLNSIKEISKYVINSRKEAEESIFQRKKALTYIVIYTTGMLSSQKAVLQEKAIIGIKNIKE